MKIEKVINNNVVSALENGREVVVMGRGIGFQLRAGMDIPGELIEKVFRLDNPGVMDQFKSLVQKLPPERLQISAEVIQYAKGVMNKKLNHNIYLTLTDHINFAIERVEMGVPFQNPFLWEIKKFYYQEYLIGKVAIGMIEKELKVTLPQDEAAFIALHIVNAELDLDMTEMVSMTKLVNDILKIVDKHFGEQIDKESVFYERFITHLKFFAQRVYIGKEVKSDDTEFQEIIRNKYHECIECVDEIKDYVKKTCNHDITDEELMYLTVHIKRVTTR